LIIEDNIDVKEAYTRIFREISGQLPWSLLPAIEPCFALSFEDGRTQLETTSVAFHLVILDLELPQKAGRPAQHGLECPANFVPVGMRQTGMRGAWNGTRKEAYAGADREPASAN
jgi:hypothetical protein